MATDGTGVSPSLAPRPASPSANHHHHQPKRKQQRPPVSRLIWLRAVARTATWRGGTATRWTYLGTSLTCLTRTWLAFAMWTVPLYRPVVNNWRSLVVGGAVRAPHGRTRSTAGPPLSLPSSSPHRREGGASETHRTCGRGEAPARGELEQLRQQVQRLLIRVRRLPQHTSTTTLLHPARRYRPAATAVVARHAKRHPPQHTHQRHEPQ